MSLSSLVYSIILYRIMLIQQKSAINVNTKITIQNKTKGGVSGLILICKPNIFKKSI